LGLTFLTPCARSSGSSAAIGRVSPAAARSSSTSDGASASIIDVSVRPACASLSPPPSGVGSPACHT